MHVSEASRLSSSLDTADHGALPVVQFSSSVYYCDEDEGRMEIEVMRIGDLSGSSSVFYRTIDGSAQAGVDFEESSGSIVFTPGQETAVVSVPLIDDDHWDTTLEFWVSLDSHSLQNAKLGRYLRRARVRIIDNDFFPSNAYREEVQQGRITDVKFGLFFEYVKLMLQNDKIRERTKRVVALDQLHNVHSLIALFLNVYLVDYILNPHKDESDLFIPNKFISLCVFVLLTVIPFGALHYMDYVKKDRFGVGGTAREIIQVALIRKFLNYDHKSRLQLRNGDLIMATTRDAAEVVQMGYQNALLMLKHIGHLVFMFVYQLVSPVLFGRKFSLLGFLPLLSFPVLLCLFLLARTRKTSKLLNDRNSAQDALVTFVAETVENYKLISDFNQRYACTACFDVLVKAYNTANRLTNVLLENNRYFSYWLVVLCIAIYTLIGGTHVVTGTLSLGMFLTNIRIFGSIGGALNDTYKIVLQITTVLPALENIVLHMNLPLDLPAHKKLNRSRRETTTALLQELKADNHMQPPVDRMPILVGNLSLRFESVARSQLERRAEHITNISHSGVLRVEQGTLVCLAGPMGGGKSTLLKVVGGQIVPNLEDFSTLKGTGEKGQLFLPSHLRVLHVQSPLFFYGTLFDNLTYGVHPNDPDARPAHVYAICTKLGVDAPVLEHLRREKAAQCTWADVLSETQCQLLSLARAIIANPEVMCLHKPTQIFDEVQGHRVASVMREFVENNGVEQEPCFENECRPRTCIITCAQKHMFDMADRIFHVSLDKGICDVDTLPHGRKGFIRCASQLSMHASSDSLPAE